MKLLCAFWADEVTKLDNEQYDVQGLRHSVTSEHFPTKRSDIQLIMVFRMEPGDDQGNVTLDLQWHAPGYSPVGIDISGTGVFNSIQEHEIGETIIMKMPMEMPFPAPGFYQFDVILGGHKVGEVPLEVIRI